MNHGPDGWLTLADASRVSATTSEAMRKRISRGMVEAVKVSRRWYVNPDSLATDVRTPTESVRTEADSNEPDTVALLRELVTTQHKHIETLERQLDEKDAQLQAMHVHLERLTRALPAPSADTESKPHRRLRWWPFG